MLLHSQSSCGKSMKIQMSRPSQHKQLMDRLDKLIETLEQGNAIAVARLKLEVQAAQKDPPEEAKILSAGDQIQTTLAQQLERSTESHRQRMKRQARVKKGGSGG